MVTSVRGEVSVQVVTTRSEVTEIPRGLSWRSDKGIKVPRNSGLEMDSNEEVGQWGLG